WDEIVDNENILHHDFDLKDVSILRPPDKRLMLITWNVHRDDGTHSYFGYLLHAKEKVRRKGLFRKEIRSEYEVHRLLDRSAAVKSPENHSGGPDQWFGMLYTTLIPV